MSRLKRLIVEIHRRSLWQVLLIYVGAAWACFELIDAVTNRLGLPTWLPGLAVVLFLLGLPFVVATAFVQEGVGGGAARSGAAAAPEAVTAEEEPTRETPGPEVRRGVRRVFTWRAAILAGLATLALLVLSVPTYMGLRAAGVGPFGTLLNRGVLEERDRVVLADFENQAGDPRIAVVATQWFRSALSQSTAVQVAGQEYVANVLRRMGREPNAPLDYELAREVAIREGLKAVTAGEVIEVGGGFVVSARLVAAETGEELWTDSEAARDSTAIVESIDRLSRRLRERIGESLRTIRSNRPLEQVTTSSLEALQKYSLGARAIHVEGDWDKGVGLLREAVDIDTAFAMAYLQAGWVYVVRDEWSHGVEAVTKAYRHRDRLTDRERYLTLCGYHLAVTGEHERAITVCRTLLDVYPDDIIGMYLLWALYVANKQFELAEEVVRRAIEVAPSYALAYWVLLNVQVAQGEFQEAQATLDRMIENRNPYSLPAAAWLAIAREDYEGAVEVLRTTKESQSGYAISSSHLAGLARLRGQLARAEREYGDAMAGWEGLGREAGYLRHAVRMALMRLQLGGGVERGLQTVEEALERHPLATIPALDRPYVQLAEFYAVAGRLDRARATLAEYDAAADSVLRWPNEWWRHRAEGYIALAEGRHAEAIAEFRLSDDRTLHNCRWCALPALADAYDLAGEPDSAVAVYERFVEEAVLGIDELHAAARYRPSVYERLGALYEQRGDTAEAIHYYAKFVELWKDADPELQPRVEAARRAIEALSPDT
ncbi:MAG: tetratricopeptide repeat protein [Gemmatimonadetes bacterium]|nr:tetratricopeptide repeat protein [Gemmatimonadota bacterium]NIO32817.1 tetratricopeptide repeat protein [Gemmatimonadota bacterium]